MSNLTSKELYGSMTALVTPMKKDGQVDYVKWEKLIYWQIKSSIKAIIVAGTTGESALLNPHEFQRLLKIAVTCCENTKTKVIAQTGHINADEVIDYNRQAYELGAQAVLVVTPYYIRTTQSGLERHLQKLPIIRCCQLFYIMYLQELKMICCQKLQLHWHCIL